MTAGLTARLVVCRGWHWLPGMANTDGERCTHVVDGVPWFADEHVYEPGEAGPNAILDLDDGLTVLALLLLVREAWRDPTLYAGVCLFGEWTVQDAGGKVCSYGSSEAEALVHALLAAAARGSRVREVRRPTPPSVYVVYKTDAGPVGLRVFGGLGHAEAFADAASSVEGFYSDDDTPADVALARRLAVPMVHCWHDAEASQ